MIFLGHSVFPPLTLAGMAERSSPEQVGKHVCGGFFATAVTKPVVDYNAKI